MKFDDMMVESIRDMMKLIPNGIAISGNDLEEIYSQEEKENDKIN